MGFCTFHKYLTSVSTRLRMNSRKEINSLSRFWKSIVTGVYGSATRMLSVSAKRPRLASTPTALILREFWLPKEQHKPHAQAVNLAWSKYSFIRERENTGERLQVASCKS